MIKFKLILTIVMLQITFSYMATAQTKFLGKFIPKANAGSVKKTRSSEKLIKIDNYSDMDTNASSNNLQLVSTESFNYNKPRATTMTFVYDMLFDGVITMADDAKLIEGLPTAADTSMTLNNFDANNRLLTSRNLVYNASKPGYDTNETINYIYTGTQTEPDSIITLDNTLALIELTKNNITNNRITKSVTYADDGNGNFGIINDVSYTYNSAGKLTKESTVVDFGGLQGNLVQSTTYYSNGLVDTMGIFFDFGLIKQPFGGVKFIYNNSLANGYMRFYSLDSNQAVQLLQSGELDLNTNKKVTRLLTRENNGIDSTNVDESYIVFNANNNVIKEYNRIFDTLTNAWQPTMDSTVYTYESLFPASIQNINKSVTQAACIPNPVAQNAFIHYNSNKSQTAQIVLIDITGKVMSTQQELLVNGNSIINLDMKHLNSGLYQCQIIINGQIQQAVKISKL